MVNIVSVVTPLYAFADPFIGSRLYSEHIDLRFTEANLRLNQFALSFINNGKLKETTITSSTIYDRATDVHIRLMDEQTGEH